MLGTLIETGFYIIVGIYIQQKYELSNEISNTIDNCLNNIINLVKRT